jgi:predicted RNA-binding Zn-ribbon protein involved in translation (DUF1610 family)
LRPTPKQTKKKKKMTIFAKCKACGENNIQITTGSTGKPLIECPKCGGQNVVEDKQSQLTTFYEINEDSCPNQKNGPSKKKMKLVPTETVQEDVNTEEKEKEKQTEVEKEKPKSKPKKYVFGANVNKKPILVIEPKKIEESKKPKQVRSRKSNNTGTNKEGNSLSALGSQVCWKCDIRFDDLLKFQNNEIKQAFFCPKCGVPQTFQCEKCVFLNSLVFDFCIGCGKKPVCLTME